MSVWTDAVAATSPYAWFKLNEASGATATDSSGNGRNAAYNSTANITYNQTSLIAGDSADKGISVNTTAANVTLSSASISQINATMAVWFKSGTDQTGRFFDAATSFRLSLNPTSVDFEIGAADTNAAYDPTALFDNNPHFIVFRSDATNATLFVDGVQVAQAAHGAGAGTQTTLRMKGNTTAPLGTYDDWIVWNTALTSTQITDLYNAGLGVGPSVTGTLSASLQRKSAVITAFAQASATLAGDLQRKTGAFTAFAQGSATLAGDLQRKTAAIALTAHPVATLGGDLQRKTSAFTLNIADAAAELALAGELQRKTAAITLDAGPVLSLAGDLQRKTSVFTLSLTSSVTLTADLQRRTALFEVSTLERPVRLDATLRRKAANITLKIPPYILLAGTLRAKTGDFSLVKPPQTDFTNTAASFTINGYGVATWTPLVVEPEAFPLMVHDYDVAIAFSTPTMVGTRAVYTTTEVMAPRHRDRIVVGGMDITFLDGIRTPTPSYRLIEPLDYGAGSLTLPQVNANFQQPGVGDLAWCAKGKPVLVQRVDVDTGEVVATDYRGFITDYDIDGSSLVCALGGEISGRMALRWHPLPVFKTLTDAGRLIADTVRANLPGKFLPLLGPVTGIDLLTFGGMNELDRFSELMAKTVTLGGAQRTVTRGDDGVWRAPLKDRTTIHFTMYLDGNRLPASLHQSMAEEHNRIFTTAVNKDGQRLERRAMPGIIQGEAAPYPFDDNSAFTEGTTDAGTDSGDGITVMVSRLIQTGFLARDDAADYLYDGDVSDAIEDLQAHAGLSVTGNMNLATWRALYNLSQTGYSYGGAMVLPEVQDPATRMWNRTSSGAYSSRNEAFDPHVIISDAQYDMGTGMTHQQVHKWAAADISDVGHWTGTLPCHIALIRGEHNPGDLITAADIMPAREVKPGMNGWAPLFDDGTLFHVSGVSVPEGGRDPELTLDTKARDTMKAWEVIQRNRDSKRSPARIWLNQYQSSRVGKDGLVTWDGRLGGRIDKVRLHAGWNHFPFPAGQAGTVERVRVETNPPTEFVASLSGREISDARMAHLIGNPLTEAGTERWEAEWVQTALRSRVWLESWGQHDQPCGYFPRRKTGDDGEPTGADLTGIMQDSAGVGFHTFAQPVLWLAIYVEDECTIPAGRIAWLQGETGT